MLARVPRISCWSGQLTLGQMSLVAVGAATGAHATQDWHLDLTLALLVAGLATAAVAAPAEQDCYGFPAVAGEENLFQTVVLISRHAERDRDVHF